MNKSFLFLLFFSGICLLTISACTSGFSSTIKVEKEKYSGFTQEGEYFHKGFQAAHNKDYASALSFFEKGCSLNDGPACSNLGLLYWKGLGVLPDYPTAQKYFEKACKIGNAHGCANLGLFYERGIGVAYDLDKAEAYAKLACDLNKTTCANLGIILANKRNFGDAKELFETSCNAGTGMACDKLSLMYMNGLGVPVNYETAKVYAQRACAFDNYFCPKTNTTSPPTLNKAKEAKVVEGRTSKKELLRNLGNPNAADTLSMTWKAPSNALEYYDINYVQKDGTSFIVCLGQQAKCKKEMVVNFMSPDNPNGRNNIVQYVYFYD